MVNQIAAEMSSNKNVIEGLKLLSICIQEHILFTLFAEILQSFIFDAQ